LAIGEQPRQCAIGAAGQAQQPFGAPVEIGQQQMRVFARLDAQMRLADQRNEIAIAGLHLAQTAPANRESAES
jgi:hypothetical protein